MVENSEKNACDEVEIFICLVLTFSAPLATIVLSDLSKLMKQKKQLYKVKTIQSIT